MTEENNIEVNYFVIIICPSTCLMQADNITSLAGLDLLKRQTIQIPNMITKQTPEVNLKWQTRLSCSLDVS